MLVNINGQLIPEENAVISVFDRGFLYGDGVFETMRSYSGHLFRLPEHLARLRRSCTAIHLALPWDDEQLTNSIQGTLEANGLSDARVRLTITRGRGHLLAKEASAPSLIITTEHFENERTALTAALVEGERYLPGVKSLNALAAVKAQAQVKDADIAILHKGGKVSEAAIGNIFIVSKGVLRTTHMQILPGITRAIVLHLAKGKWAIEEGDITADELCAAEECFLTNSVVGIMPITSIDGEPVGDGKRGPVTRRLQDHYRAQVEKEANHASP